VRAVRKHDGNFMVRCSLASFLGSSLNAHGHSIGLLPPTVLEYTIRALSMKTSVHRYLLFGTTG
jgi:hypothetical protein